MGCMMRDFTVCVDELGDVTLRELEFAELAMQLCDTPVPSRRSHGPAGNGPADAGMDAAFDLLRWSSCSNASRAYLRHLARWRVKRCGGGSVH